jgi:hypothetical protein
VFRRQHLETVKECFDLFEVVLMELPGMGNSLRLEAMTYDYDKDNYFVHSLLLVEGSLRWMKKQLYMIWTMIGSSWQC